MLSGEAQEVEVADLTITIDDEVLERAERRAQELNTSLDALLREYLESYAAGSRTAEEATRAILEIADRVDSGSGGRRWTRDELYDRR